MCPPRALRAGGDTGWAVLRLTLYQQSELPGTLNRSSRDSLFVGRESELELLRGDLAAARSGAGGVVFIHGEAGIGKTSLARAIAREAEAAGARVFWGRGYEGGWSPPYTPWLEALPGITADIEPIESLDPEESRFRFHDAIARHLRELSSDKMLVLVFDELQWADNGSLELMRHLAHFGLDTSTYIVATYRDSDVDPGHPLAQLQAQLRRVDHVRSLSLDGLGPEEITRLLESSGMPGVSADESERLCAATDGNPLFVTELVEHWRNEGGPESSLVVSGPIPDAARHVVQYRLERLSKPAQTVLSNTVVFTAGFDFGVLPHLTGFSEVELLDAIDELLAARLIEAKLDAGAERYDFVHSLVREALISPLSPSRVVRLERNAAVSMERAYGDGADAHASEIAIQYGRSASLAGAEAGLRYALIAADRAQRGFDREQIAFFYRIARDLVAHSAPEIRASVLCKLAVAEADAVHIEDAVAAGADAIQALEQSNATREDNVSFYGDLIVALKEHASAANSVWRPLLDAALAVASSDRDQFWARIALLADPVQPVSRDAIRAGRWIGFDPEAVAIARSSGDERTAARAVESFDYRNRSETESYLALARTWKDPAAMMYGLTVSANDFQYRHGAFREAELIWEELIAIAARHGAISWQAQAMNQLTILHIARGRFALAKESEERANALLDRLGAGRRSDVLALEMETALALELGGNWPGLASAWRAVIADPALGPNDRATLMSAYYASLAAYCSAEAGDETGTRSLLDVLAPVLEAMSPGDPNHNGAVAMAASAVWMIECIDLAPRLHKLALELWRQQLGDYPQTSIALTIARMAALSGRADEATEFFAKARTVLDESGQRPLRAKVDLDEATFLTKSAGNVDHDSIGELLRRSGAAFEEIGMTEWAERARSKQLSSTGLASSPSDFPAGLSIREVEVLRLVARGHSDRQISDDLFISRRTVNSHIRNMLNKTGAVNRTDLSVWAVQQGLANRDE